MKYKYFLLFIGQKQEQWSHNAHHMYGYPLILIVYIATINLSILIFYYLYCFSDFVVFYFLLAFGADKRRPVWCLLEPSATFARRVAGNIRFCVFWMKHFLATDIAVYINLVANFTLVPFEFVRTVRAGDFKSKTTHKFFLLLLNSASLFSALHEPCSAAFVYHSKAFLQFFLTPSPYS